MATVLITGANRDLGLEFVKQYANAAWQVIACCRNPALASALQELASQHSNIQIETLDVADFDQIDQLAHKLVKHPIDVLINNAGVYGDIRARGFKHLDYHAWTQNFIVNSQAPLRMVEAFFQNLKQGQQKLIVNISTLMASITDNTSGGSILYRSSKAALNATMKSLAIDLHDQGIGVLILHPGWVKTDMGGPNGLIDADESVSGMRRIIADFTLEQSGNFLNYDGSGMPW